MEEERNTIEPVKILTPHEVHASELENVSEEAMKETFIEDKKMLGKSGKRIK
jgi:hypothetical protein